MRDKVERILIKFGGLNLWSPQVRNSLIDELDKELKFGTSGDISIESKKETNDNTMIKTEDLPADNRKPSTTRSTPTQQVPVNDVTEKVDDVTEKVTLKRGKKIKLSKKSNNSRRSAKNSRVKSDNRNVEDIEMLPKPPR